MKKTKRSYSLTFSPLGVPILLILTITYKIIYAINEVVEQIMVMQSWDNYTVGILILLILLLMAWLYFCYTWKYHGTTSRIDGRSKLKVSCTYVYCTAT